MWFCRKHHMIIHKLKIQTEEEAIRARDIIKELLEKL